MNTLRTFSKVTKTFLTNKKHQTNFVQKRDIAFLLGVAVGGGLVGGTKTGRYLSQKGADLYQLTTGSKKEQEQLLITKLLPLDKINNFIPDRVKTVVVDATNNVLDAVIVNSTNNTNKALIDSLVMIPKAYTIENKKITAVVGPFSEPTLLKTYMKYIQSNKKDDVKLDEIVMKILNDEVGKSLVAKYTDTAPIKKELSKYGLYLYSFTCDK